MDNVLTRSMDIGMLSRGHMPRPYFADLHTSNRCQQTCTGCAYRNKLDGKIMAREDHLRVMEDLYNLGVRAFDFAGGGDPLCLPYIMDLWEWCVKKKCHFGVITNGIGFTLAMMTFLIDHATYVRVSLEASDAKKYCRYKNSTERIWYEVLNNIRCLTEEDSTLEVGLKFSVGKSLRGIDHYQNGMLLGHDLRVDNVQFKALRHEPEELTIDEKYVEHYQCEEGKQLVVNQNKGFVQSWIMPWDWEGEDIPQCILNPLHTVVDHNGNVYLCCYYYCRGANHKLGNMLDTPINEFWDTCDHRTKIQKIDKKECTKVDCKFFRHHKIIQQATNRGRGLFL